MQAIIPPVDHRELEKELTLGKFLRNTNNGGNLLYITDYEDSPNIMREIGRLRELSFRAAGGGTGKDLDIDEFDIAPGHHYSQLIVWDPKAKQILGGYRFIRCQGHDIKHLATSELFTFSDQFKENYFPHTIELGRSFVQPNYQSTQLRSKGLYALDNLWDGLGALICKNPDVHYFFGKVTMYGSFNVEARDMLLYFLRKHFSDKDHLVSPIECLPADPNLIALEKLFTGTDYKEDYKILSKSVRNLGENIPPLINSYMNLTPSMRVFGTALNHEFGQVEETGILIKISDIYADRLDRYVGPFMKMMHRIREFRR